MKGFIKMRRLTALFFACALSGCSKPGEVEKNEGTGVNDMRAKAYVSENKFRENLTNQLSMTPQTLQQLRGYGVNEKKELKLEYFFYTNTKAKADKLVEELKKSK